MRILKYISHDTRIKKKSPLIDKYLRQIIRLTIKGDVVRLEAVIHSVVSCGIERRVATPTASLTLVTATVG